MRPRPRGQLAQRSIGAALRTAFPTYRLVDVGRVFDQYTGLCVLDFRARNGAGTVLVLEVVSPGNSAPRTPTVAVASRAQANLNVSTARSISGRGWQVTVGMVGRLSDRLPEQVLREFARSDALRW